MELQIGTGQEVNIHDVESVKVEETYSLKMSQTREKYFRTMHIKTKRGEDIEITLFSSKKNVLEYKD